MLRIRKWHRGLYSSFILTLLSGIAVLTAWADDPVPTGFKPDRYQTVWERNPFTLVTPTIAAVRTTPFDKLILVSWLNDAGKDVVFVQNTDTSEVQKVTSDPNPNNLKLVEIHKNPDPQKAEVVLSNGAEQGSVKFRLETPPASPQVDGGQPPALPPGGAPSKFPASVQGMPAPPVPGMSRQMQFQQNAQQQGAHGAAVQVPAQSISGTAPPRASEVRRKRITPPPTNEQPVSAPVPIQNPSNQSLPQ